MATTSTADDWRDRLIEEHADRARGLTRRFWSGARRLGLDADDLEDEAMFALWIAADEFDVALGVPFWPYARRRILWDLLDLLRQRKRELASQRRRTSAVPTTPPADDEPCRRDRIARSALAESWATLTTREAEIVWRRFYSDRGIATWDAVAFQAGLSRGSVMRIGSGALDKLRSEVKKRINAETI